jgi:putative ATP-dependent endonuclease of OLD family
MRKIKKIILKNFKKFKNLEIDFNDHYNILIGDNEAGKSSILTAIDLVLSGSRSKIENLGLENLFNINVIQDFLASHQKETLNLPTLEIELYFHAMNNFELCGKNNSKQENCDGLKLICKHKKDLELEINDILQNSSDNFPFEYYDITFNRNKKSLFD